MHVVGRITAPQGVHALIPQTSEYVALHGEKDVADVIKVKGLEMRR